MSPLSISSMGELNRSPLSISTRGELTIVAIVPIERRRRGGLRFQKDPEQQEYLALIKREDEEILAIIMSSMDLLE